MNRTQTFVGTSIVCLISGPTLIATAFRPQVSVLSRSATMSVSIERTLATRPDRRSIASISILVKHAEAQFMKNLAPEERLIVAADFKPTTSDGRKEVQQKVLSLAASLRGTGVYLKVNSALRSCGYDLIGQIQSYGLKVFADLKLFDISETLGTDGALLREVKPELLTVACSVGVSAMKALKTELPETEVLGVTVLTSLTEADTQTMFSCSTLEAALRLGRLAGSAYLDGLISSAKEAAALRANMEVLMTINTPGIRPVWAVVPGDDQNPDRVMTPQKAIKAGADRIVVGRPIVGSANPYDAVMRTIDEIQSAIA